MSVIIKIKKIIRLVLSLKTVRMRPVREMIAADKRFNETFRFGGNKMPASFRRQPEWKFIKFYRKYHEDQLREDEGNVSCGFEQRSRREFRKL